MTDVLIVLPVYNERIALEGSVRRIHGFLERSFPFSWQILIVDNASIDGTHQIARRLTYELDRVDAMHLPEKGRGRALRAAWSEADARVLSYMDVDLSTGLTALLPLVAPLVSGHSDVAIGTRLARGAHVTRGVRREFISRAYSRLLHLVLRSRFSDAQCGFKAVRRDVAEALLPQIKDQEWFFDTELLVLAERAGLRIHEVPVDWVEDTDTRVQVVPAALAGLRGVARLLVHRRSSKTPTLLSPKQPMLAP
jgi:glycosyltransferase involved in cell wall biosynthesis